MLFKFTESGSSSFFLSAGPYAIASSRTFSYFYLMILVLVKFTIEEITACGRFRSVLNDELTPDLNFMRGQLSLTALSLSKLMTSTIQK